MTPRKPKTDITVLIPIKELNKETLKKCTSTLNNQSLKSFNIFFIAGNQRVDVAVPKNVTVFSESEGTRAGAMNEVLNFITTTFFVTTDDDCIPDRDWLKNLVDEFNRHGCTVAGLGGPNYGAPSDNFCARCVDVVYGSKFVTGGTRYGKEYGKLQSVDHNSGCNACYRTETIKEADVNFDNVLPTAEDVVFDYKLRAKGYKILYTPKAFVWHQRRPTIRGFFKQIFKYGKGRAMANKKYPALKSKLHYAPIGIVVGWPILFFLPITISVLGLAFYFGVCLYGTFNTVMPLHSKREKFCAAFLVPVAHFAWGLGYLRGLVCFKK